MGDIRYLPPYERVRRANDRAFAIALLTDEEVIAALAAASRGSDPLLANVLATEAMNRMLRARAILQHIPVGVIAVDRAGVVTSLNPAAEEHLGYREAELRSFTAHAMLHPDAPEGGPRAPDRCPLEACMRSAEPLGARRDTLVRKDGNPLDVTFTAAPLLRDGIVVGAVIAFRPVGGPVDDALPAPALLVA